MVAFLYTEGIQQTAAHSGGRCSDLTFDYKGAYYHSQLKMKPQDRQFLTPVFFILQLCNFNNNHDLEN